MRYFGLFFVVLALLLAACGAPEFATPEATTPNNADVIEGQYIVVLNDTGLDVQAEDKAVFTARVETASRELGVALLEPLQIINGFSAKFDEAKLSDLEADPRVAYVEQDFYIYLNATQSPAPWGLNYIDGSNDNTYTYNSNGTGVTAYIIDSGIRSDHVDFNGRVDISRGGTTVQDGRGTEDCNGHGTHVASTVGGRTYGVAKNVTLVPVRVFDCSGRSFNSGSISALDFVTRTASGPTVVNMSLGGPASRALDTSVANATRAGINVVVAAGNETQNACNVSPARARSAITVGSATRNLARSSFSNFGSCVDIFAPGSDVTAAWPSSRTGVNTISGTSMASPHVAGVVALILEKNPNVAPSTIANYLSDTALNNILSGVGPGSPNKFMTKGDR